MSCAHVGHWPVFQTCVLLVAMGSPVFTIVLGEIAAAYVAIA